VVALRHRLQSVPVPTDGDPSRRAHAAAGPPYRRGGWPRWALPALVVLVLTAAAGVVFGTGLGSRLTGARADDAGTPAAGSPPATEPLPSAAGTTGPSPAVTSAPGAAPRRGPAPASPAGAEATVDPARVPTHGSGQFAVVPGGAPAAGPGRRFRYRLEIEAGLPFDPAAVARIVQRDLTDPRGWQPIQHVAFERTSGAGYDIRLLIASPDTTDALCAPLGTGGQLSCRSGSHVVLNALRWAVGIPGYAGHLADYHAYMLNHEVGHALGYHHAYCTVPGGPAPVMMQQTKGLGRCRPNPWPSVNAG
jgi:hypothetical protein